MMPAMFRPILFLSVALWLAQPPPAHAQDTPKPESAGLTPEGQALEIHTLKNAHGLEARVLNWGATLVKMSVPDRAGKFADVTLGFDDPKRYLSPHPFFGSIAGRYANRIAKGQFALDGNTFELAKNNGPNHLHGGTRGFDKRIWKVEQSSPASARFSYVSPDGEEGYPGTLSVSVTYTLTDKDELRLEYEARTDKPTVLNLTNHTYWNLAGTGDVLGHILQLHASRYTVVDPGLIPTGAIQTVKDTPLDFTVSKQIGRDIEALKGEGFPGGYDHNFVIDRTKSDELALCAEVLDPASGRMMRVLTTEPGVQFYTANGLNNVAGKAGATYGKHAGFCLETQHYPDSPNHPEFPKAELRPGGTFHSTTVYEFSVR